MAEPISAEEPAKLGAVPNAAMLERAGSGHRSGRVMPINLRTLNREESDSVASQEQFERRPSLHSPRSRGNSAEICGGSPAISPLKTRLASGGPPAGHRRTASSSERILELRGPGKRSWLPSSVGTGSKNLNGLTLFVRRLQKTRERQSAQAQEESELGLRELQQTFAAQSASIGHTNWELWATVVGDYDNVARNQPHKLKQAIQDGFPPELRGLLWQVISSSKSTALEQLYVGLVSTETAPCTTAINKDLDRTPMAKNVDRGALARLLTAYSLFDEEVGYTQGMAFIAVPLLMQLPEAEAFSLFVQLMKTYDFRSVFTAGMPGLHLRLYQFDRMLEDTLESVHTHLRRQGVQSSMYASQWFITVFAYRFPPSLVTRMFDIVIAEGIEALLRFAFSLMQSTAPDILQRQGLDELLPFLKEKIFDKFDGNENELVKLASSVELLPQVLSKYELEHQELNRLEKERMEQMDVLRSSNVRLSLQNKQLESSLEALNVEHIQLANQMVSNGMELARLRDENHDLSEKLGAVLDHHQIVGELSTKLKERDAEVAELRRANETMQVELALLKRSQEVVDNSVLVKENEQLREVKLRYELQLGSLQESLASALDN